MLVHDVMIMLGDGHWKTKSNITIVNCTGGRTLLRPENIYTYDDELIGTKFSRILNSYIKVEKENFVVYLSKSDI